MTILLLVGSAREGSLHGALAAAAAEVLADHEVTRFPIADLPFYNQDLDGDARPQVVRDFLAAVEAADALLFVTPEYNHGLPAVVKNAIDWASRPAFVSPLQGKPYTVLTASPSPVGGVHAQADLKHVMDATLAVVYPSVAYALGGAHAKITDGSLTDPQGRRRLERHLTGFVAWLDQAAASAPDGG
jgi:chromate reductase